LVTTRRHLHALQPASRKRFAYAGIALATLFLTAACSSGGGAGAAAAPAPVVILDEREARLSAALGTHVIVDDLTTVDSLPASQPKAHEALVLGYEAVGFRSLLVNPATGLVAVADMTVRSTFAQQPLSRFVSCGSTIAGPRADQDRIALSVVTHVKPGSSPGWSRVETRVVATATDTEGTRGRQGCTTTGQLEVQILQAARKTLGA
jgi:hypothetical protein